MTRKNATAAAAAEKKNQDNVLSSDENDAPATKPSVAKNKEGVMDRYAESAGVDLSQMQLVDVGIFESYTMLISAIGALEFGFMYTTIFCQIIMTVAFAEMVKLQRIKDKEAKIIIQSKIMEWYFFFCFQLMLIPKTWLTLSMLKKSGLAPEAGSILYMLCYEYHSLTVFCLLTLGIILFVVSLQEGFYSYQFKMLGWTITSALLIITGSSGLLLSLWKCRIWFIYAICCITAHNAFDYLACHYLPFKTPIMMLKPEATFEGFTIGVIACFLFFTVTVTYIVDISWFLQTPTMISLIPFDNTAHTLATGPIYEKTMQTITWTQQFGLGPISFVASELQLHLFVITIFVAFVAPFGGFLFSGLKRAMRQSSIGITMYKGGVIDRLDCIIITGCFMLVYINMLVYKNQVPEVSTVLDMVTGLSDQAQIDLYNRLKNDLMQAQVN